METQKKTASEDFINELLNAGWTLDSLFVHPDGQTEAEKRLNKQED